MAGFRREGHKCSITGKTEVSFTKESNVSVVWLEIISI